MPHYSHFFLLLSRVTNVERLTPSELKAQFVSQFTAGRTTHLHLMSPAEYRHMIRTLEVATGWAAEISRQRGRVLNLLQALGIDPGDRDAVNAYIASPRLATYRDHPDGRRQPKPFAHLSMAELQKLATQLHMILKRCNP